MHPFPIEPLESRIAPAALSVASANVSEGNSGITNLIFTVSLDQAETSTVSVDFATADGTATSRGAAADFQPVSGTLSFAPGETSKSVTVPIIGDAFKEAAETFTLNLTNPQNAQVSNAQGTGTIDDDGDTIVGLTVSDPKVVEGDSGSKTATFTVTLSGPSDTDTSFVVGTRNGTAVAGEDYVAIIPNPTAPLTIPAGETSRTVNVTVRGDTLFESTESFFLDVENVSANVVVVDAEGRGSIYNDDLQRVDLQTIRYVDADGDLATVRITKGVLTSAGAGSVLNFSAPNAIGGRILQKIDFTGAPLSYNHTDLFVTAAPQAGFAAAGGVSDGRVDVGFIQAGIAQGDIFQLFNNIDFGTIVVQGDLGKIIAGDQVATDRAVVSLNILSHGARGTATGAPDNESLFLGGTGSVVVRGDATGLIQAIGGDRGDFENITIKGALRGGAADASGQIFFTGSLINARVGTIIGGAGANSGSIFGSFTRDSTIGSGADIAFVRVIGDVVGGGGANSGKILAPNINVVVVGTKSAPANVIGGAGAESGVILAGENIARVAIRGDLVGGVGRNSAEIFSSGSIGIVKVAGSMLGGAGTESGSIVAEEDIASVVVLESIQGAAGDQSGTIQADGTLGYFQVGADLPDSTEGNIRGGSGIDSGGLRIEGNLTNAKIFGSLLGGTANGSGAIGVGGLLANLEIAKNVEGGSSTSGVSLANTGFIAAEQIGILLISGDVKAGTNGGTGLVNSGAIRASGDIAALVIGGDLAGNSTARAIISGGGQTSGIANQTIRFLRVGGDTTSADILGGYGTSGTVQNPLGDPTNPDAQIGTIIFKGAVAATNVVAGVVPGADGRFGTADDLVISGTGVVDRPGVRSMIGSIVIKGTVATNAEIYGVVAQVITAAKVGGTVLPLNPTAPDDRSLGGDTSNFRLHELPNPA